MNNTRRTAFSVGTVLFAVLIILVSVGPFCLVVCRSFLSDAGVSFRSYYEVLWAQSQYLIRFWKSLFISLCAAMGHLVVSVLAGYGFARYRFPGRNAIFFLITILITLPIQVTLVPNYIMLNRLGLLDTYAALILPQIFMPLGTFILRQSFLSVSDSVIDAAMLDGCNTLQVLWRIAMPMNFGGIICAFLLSFLDTWNMVEQPIAYLKDMNRYPISIAVVYVAPTDVTIQLVCCILVTVPCLFFFLFFSRELVDGIVLAEVK